MERIALQSALRAGETQAAVAVRLNRSPGTISQELKRNGGRAGYCAAGAHEAALSRRGASQRGRCAIAEHSPLRDEIHARMQQGWSPEEIAGSLKADHPDLPRMHTCHESIYRYVYVVARGELKRELVAGLRCHHNQRKGHSRGTVAAQGRLKDMVLIDERAPEVETRLIAGHSEGDLIVGAGHRSGVGVLVERTTRYTWLCHLPQKRRPERARSLHPQTSERVSGFAQNPHVRPGQRNGRARHPRRRAWPEDLFLPRTQPLGTRHLREPKLFRHSLHIWSSIHCNFGTVRLHPFAM